MPSIPDRLGSGWIRSRHRRIWLQADNLDYETTKILITGRQKSWLRDDKSSFCGKVPFHCGSPSVIIAAPRAAPSRSCPRTYYLRYLWLIPLFSASLQLIPVTISESQYPEVNIQYSISFNLQDFFRHLWLIRLIVCLRTIYATCGNILKKNIFTCNHTLLWRKMKYTLMQNADDVYDDVFAQLDAFLPTIYVGSYTCAGATVNMRWVNSWTLCAKNPQTNLEKAPPQYALQSGWLREWI